MVIIHTVPDYERWAMVAREDRLRDSRLTAMTVSRSVDDPNEVMVQLEFDSLDAAKELMASTRFRDLLDRAGVEIYPPVFIGKIVDDMLSRP
jgi:hypothetical protein